ncbi:MAG: NHL repeat-containing protein, partial [Methanospirillum sp.]|uniref:NHL repeat-containing protein n=1 Tax=Methanospirillum sp. TaxID=45200 RepID=UPI002370AA8C
DKGVFTGSFPVEKTNTSNKYWATDIALGHDGYLYCYIFGDNTLRILDSRGTQIRRENLPQTGRRFSHLALNSADDVILSDQNSITCFQKTDSLSWKTATGGWNETRNQSFLQNKTYTTWNVPVEVIRSPFIHYTMSAIQDADGSIFATAAENDGVVKTDPLGHKIFSINHGISKSDLQKPEYCMCAGYNRTRSIQNPIYEPVGIVQDTSGNLYISTNTGIDKFSRDGENLSAIEPNSTMYCNLSTPAGLAFSPDGVLYVADSNRNCIVAFSPDGKRINEWGHKGILDGEFKEPWGVAVDQKGTVYVTDTMNHRVQTFTANGTWTGTWGSKGSDIGRFSRPTGILADSDGLIYISDSGNFRIQIFTGNGTPLGEIIPYSADLRGRPGVYGLFKNSDGDIYAVSNSNGSILKVLWSLKEQGTANGSIITIEPPDPVVQVIVNWGEEISWIAHQLYVGNDDQILSAVFGEREA